MSKIPVIIDGREKIGRKMYLVPFSPGTERIVLIAVDIEQERKQ
jgi:hypothetical protein